MLYIYTYFFQKYKWTFPEVDELSVKDALSVYVLDAKLSAPPETFIDDIL